MRAAGRGASVRGRSSRSRIAAPALSSIRPWAVLETQPYPLLAVEDVIAEAQVSRTTFYRHFDSKFAIFRELPPAVPGDALYEIYDELGRYPAPTVPARCATG